jgi:hypothetical protein
VFIYLLPSSALQCVQKECNLFSSFINNLVEFYLALKHSMRINLEERGGSLCSLVSMLLCNHPLSSQIHNLDFYNYMWPSIGSNLNLRHENIVATFNGVFWCERMWLKWWEEG